MRQEGLKQMALDIFLEALRAADPLEAVHRYLKVKGALLELKEIDYFLDQFRRIWVIGAGKASARMAKAVEESLSERIHSGVVIVKYGYEVRLKKIQVLGAGHPIPDAQGLKATQKLLELAEKIEQDDLVINLISGGGSALLVAPESGISLEDKQRLTQMMLEAGLRIDEINTVRKHISQVKGGKLAQKLYPATVISLILSDVVGDALEVIASGPTVPDPSTFEQAKEILRRSQLWEKIPVSVRKLIEKGIKGEQEETPKPGDKVFERVQYLIIGSNYLSLKSACKFAQKLGFNTMILTSAVQGEVKELAKFYGSIFREVLKSGNPLSPPACIIAGGEPTVKVKGDGKGGRAQELALAVAKEIDGLEGALFLSAGTDGTDGPTEAAGAVCDFNTLSRARARGMDPEEYLARNDSYHFFYPLGDLVITGPTGTNVMDVHILLVG